MFTFIENKIKEFAREAHASVDQKRKYTGEPYIVHPIRVAELVKKFGGTTEQVCAAFLHDVVEDVEPYTYDFHFGDGNLFKTKIHELLDDSNVDADKVIQIVFDLTDEFIKEKYPDKNRRTRKALEVEHKKNISPESKMVKLCDVIDNTEDISKNDKNFAKVYLKEIQELMTALKGSTSEEAYKVAKQGLDKAKKEIYK